MIALAVAFAAASAATARASDSPASDNPSPEIASLPEISVAPVVLRTSTPESEFSIIQASVPEVTLQGVHYRPRRSGSWGSRTDAQTASQFHLGFFDPDGSPSRRFLMGLRAGPMIDKNVQIGVGLDWAHQTDNVSSVTQQSTGPGGTQITVRRDLARASTNLFPIMGFLQVSADDNLQIVPYVGIAGGYQVMNLNADDFLTNASFDATYGGWGWQLWGGAAFPLSGRSRLNTEVFVNTAELGRDVTDPATGDTWHETVKANGLGMRLGLAWGF
jgi:hypothetical protein